jgi:hypothetical protein
VPFIFVQMRGTYSHPLFDISAYQESHTSSRVEQLPGRTA